MKLDQILCSERTKTAKKSMSLAFSAYFSNREKTLQKIDQESFKKELRQIKEYSISNLSFLKKQAIKTLESQNIKVFEAKDAKQAREIILKLIPKNEQIIKTKSNTIHEIDLLKQIKNKLIETDCGDFLVQLCKEESSHPVTPALHIPIGKMVQKIKEEYGVKIDPDPIKITHWARNQIRKEILKSNIGLTGANAISSDGAIFILENEGNISLASRLPEKHIIVIGIDKIVPTIHDALKICQAQTIWGSGINLPAYINIISSPSKTADVQKQTVYGMQGAKEVCLILVDNSRSEMIKNGFEELLYCINCGSCLYFCPVYKQIFDNYGLHYFGGRGIGMTLFQNGVKKAFDQGLFMCTTCQACKENCPLEIDTSELIRKLRKLCVDKNLETLTNKKMIENIRAIGNPFGEDVKEGKLPDKLFCC